MQAEFESVFGQFDHDIFIKGNEGLDLWYFYTYPEILWYLSSNGNEGWNLNSFSIDGACEQQEVTAEEEQALLQQLAQDRNFQSKGEQAEKWEPSSRCDRGRHPAASKRKVCWTPELHGMFVEAVEQLGIHDAMPTKVLKLMGVPGLTRHHIASHLQKYRSSIRCLQKQARERASGSKTRTRQPEYIRLSTNSSSSSHILKSCQESEAETGVKSSSIRATSASSSPLTPVQQLWDLSTDTLSKKRCNQGEHQWPSPPNNDTDIPAAPASETAFYVAACNLQLDGSASI